LSRYAISLYWAFTTISTVGFGDIAGTSRTEYGVIMVGMLVGASAFGYVIGNVFAMMESFDLRDAAYKAKMDGVENFLIDREV